MNQQKSMIIAIIVALLAVVAGIVYLSFYNSTTINEDKKYIGNSVEECSRIRFVCESGYEYFADEDGCGCQKTKDPESFYCTPESRNGGACTKEYVPVCGWNDPEKIQCIRYPCAQNYGNACEACANENVISYSKGMCPN